MLSQVEVPRNTQVDNTIPNWFKVITSEGVIRHPHFNCTCGKNVALDTYSIDNQGNVQPEFFHDPNKGGCGYKAQLSLRTWEGVSLSPLEFKRVVHN